MSRKTAVELVDRFQEEYETRFRLRQAIELAQDGWMEYAELAEILYLCGLGDPKSCRNAARWAVRKVEREGTP